MDAARTDDGDAGPATAGDFVPERAAPQEQIVLLMHDPKAGPLARMWRWVANNGFSCVVGTRKFVPSPSNGGQGRQGWPADVDLEAWGSADMLLYP